MFRVCMCFANCNLASLECEAGLSVGQLAPVPPEDGEAMQVHTLREDMTHLRDINRGLYSLLSERTSLSLSHSTD